MAGFNGSGTFVRTHNWVTDKGNSVKVTASRMDTEDDGFATGLSTAITKDGQQTTTAAIPFAVGVKLNDGTFGTPALQFTSDTDTGFYRIGANNIGLSVGGAKVWDYGTATASVLGSVVIGGALNGASANFTSTCSAAVLNAPSHVGASATYTATCQANTVVAIATARGATVKSTGLTTGASANFTATCAAAVLAAPSHTGASANFTATCQAAALVSTGLVTGTTVGYYPGVGGSVTQLTNKSTGVTLNKICGQIIMNNAQLNASTSVAFTVTNSTMGSDDTVALSIKNEATPGSYLLQVCAIAAGSFAIHVRNTTAGNLSEALNINFAIIKTTVT